MTQHSYNVPEGSGLAVRSGFNVAVQALASNNLGDSEPLVKFPTMLWPDAVNKLLWMRTSTNDGWFPIGKLDVDNLGLLPVAGGEMAGALNEALAPSVASAVSPDIWSVAGNAMHVTGAVSIAGFAAAPQAGARRTLVFDGVLTLLAGANLLLPSGADIVTAAGDCCVVLAESKTSFRVLSYQRASGLPLVAPKVDTSAGIPVGGILLSFNDTEVGYILADGSQNLSRTVYAALFAKYGTRYGAGDGSTTFGIPDGRGVVPRGLDNGLGLDAGRTLGSYQADAIASHAVAVNDPGHSHGTGGGGGGPYYLPATLTYASNPMGIKTSSTSSATGITASYAGATETRMKNLAVNFFIKY